MPAAHAAQLVVLLEEPEHTETWLRQTGGICATKPHTAAVIRAAVSREKSSVLTNLGHLMV